MIYFLLPPDGRDFVTGYHGTIAFLHYTLDGTVKECERSMAEATIRDVARRADVSVASVSRTLNSPTTVHPATRERVLRAIADLHYVPHAGARSLSMRSSHTIGVVLPDLHGEFFSELVRGMDREAGALGYQLLLSTMHADAELASQALRAMRGRVDGLIVMAPQLDPMAIESIVPAALPAVLINSADCAERHLLRIDNRLLLQAGRRRIVHVSGPSGNIDANQRADAYRETLHRMAPESEPLIVEGDFSERGGEAAVERLIMEQVHFDALFGANDMMALGAIEALRSRGITVPGQVAVAGFDDIPLARYLDLTTVRVCMDELGARAVSRLVSELRGEATDRSVELIEPTLVVRGSSGGK
jgi:LacI family transcriptional regulator